MQSRLPFLLAVFVVLSACRKPEAPASTETPSPAVITTAEPKPVSTLDTYSSKALDLLKDGRDLAGKYTEEAKKAAAKLNPETLKGQAADLLTAIEQGDYSAAAQGAATLDALLKSDIVSSTITFLQINAREGAAAAAQAIDAYLAKQDISPKASDFFVQLKKDIGRLDKAQALQFTTVSIIVASDLSGNPGAGHLTGIALGLLFDEKDGVFKLQGYEMPVDPGIKKMLTKIGLSPSPTGLQTQE